MCCPGDDTHVWEETRLLPVWRLEWCHTLGWVSLNARWVVSHAPTCVCHSNAVFVSVWSWAERAHLRTSTFSGSPFQPCLSDCIGSFHSFFFFTALPHSSVCSRDDLLEWFSPVSLCPSHSFLSCWTSDLLCPFSCHFLPELLTGSRFCSVSCSSAFSFTRNHLLEKQIIHVTKWQTCFIRPSLHALYSTVDVARSLLHPTLTAPLKRIQMKLVMSSDERHGRPDVCVIVCQMACGREEGSDETRSCFFVAVMLNAVFAVGREALQG